MKIKGTVIRVEGEESVIEVPPSGACSKCCSCSASGERYMRISTATVPGARVGDTITVDMDRVPMMKVYLMMYAFPMAGFIAALFAVYAVTGSPVYSFAAGLACTAVVYLGVKKYLARHPIPLPGACME